MKYDPEERTAKFGEHFIGNMDEARAYNRVLSHGEVSVQFQRRKHTPPEPVFGTFGSQEPLSTVNFEKVDLQGEKSYNFGVCRLVNRQDL